jgi:hypothetical protein
MSCEQQWGNHHFIVIGFLFSFFNDSRVLTLPNPTSGLVRQYDFPVPLRCRKMSDMVLLRLFAQCRSLSDAFPRVVRTLANR